MLQQPGNQLRGWILSNNDDRATLGRDEIRANYYNKQKYPVTFKMKNTEAVRSTFPTSMLTSVSRKECLQKCWQRTYNYAGSASSISNRSNRIWSRVWIGAGVRVEMVSRSAELIVFLNFIRRDFFVRTLRAAQGKFAPHHCEVSADNADSNNHQWVQHISRDGYHPLIKVVSTLKPQRQYNFQI